ncbi:MAG: hypothetical protein HQ518_18375 [Rhodopirellula sp.]|nr:hypothetical protein [Rhodopirellula sp.]
MTRNEALKLTLILGLVMMANRSTNGAERFLLGPPDDGEPVCSILVPAGWFPEAISGESDLKYRFIFEPVKGRSPTIILDIDESADLDALQSSWKSSLKPIRLLEHAGPGREYFDPDRKLAWSFDASEYATSVTVSIVKNRLYRFRFVDNRKMSVAFRTTIQQIIDSCDFKAKLVPPPPAPREELARRFANVESIPFELNYQDLIGVTGLEWKLGIVVGVVLLSLAGLERFLRARKDAQRIADAEAAIEAREAVERSGGILQQSLLEPEGPPRPKASSRRRKKVPS